MHVALYNIYFATLGGGERRTAALASHLAKRHEVTLFVGAPIDVSSIFGHFGIDMGAVRIVALGERDHAAEIAKRRPNLLINNSYGSRLINPAPLGIYMCMFPAEEAIDLESYQVITANSHYTSSWIKRRWRYDAEVVYSACADFGPPLPKEKMILSVARFFADGPDAHHKRQDVLLDVFRRIADEGGTDWELRFIGSLGGGDEDKAFLESLQANAAGYPVRITPNAGFDTLRDHYRRAAIFWHGTGFGTTPETQPAKQEHFGMTIVEAMSAGAIPMAFNSGGPRETISSGINGYLWNDPTELKQVTRQLMVAPEDRHRLAEAAVAASRRFMVGAFLSRMDEIIERLAIKMGPCSPLEITAG